MKRITVLIIAGLTGVSCSAVQTVQLPDPPPIVLEVEQRLEPGDNGAGLHLQLTFRRTPAAQRELLANKRVWLRFGAHLTVTWTDALGAIRLSPGRVRALGLEAGQTASVLDAETGRQLGAFRVTRLLSVSQAALPALQCRKLCSQRNAVCGVVAPGCTCGDCPGGRCNENYLCEYETARP